MSLWRQRTAIEHAVAGLLGPEDEAKLRSHLRGCHECRRYYDALTVKARILAGDPHASTASASERELARLMGAIDPAASVAKVPEVPPWWPRFTILAGVAAAMVFGLISWQQSARVESEPIAWRGGPTEPDAGPGFELWVVTAPKDGGELRRDVVFPSDPVAAVRADEWIAFAKKGSIELLRVVLVNGQGETLVLAGGQSVSLDPGKWRAFGIGLAPLDQDPHGLEDEVLSGAARDAGVDGRSLKLPPRAHQVSGTVLVQP